VYIDILCTIKTVIIVSHQDKDREKRIETHLTESERVLRLKCDKYDVSVLLEFSTKSLCMLVVDNGLNNRTGNFMIFLS
jgi:hypothetical protein